MSEQTTPSGRGFIGPAIALYLTILAAELVLKIFSVIHEFSGNVVASSLSATVGEALRFLVPDILLYLVTVGGLYVLFAVLNAHYARLISLWAVSRQKGGDGRHHRLLGFSGVNGTFILGVYGLNAALYPASNLAFVGNSVGLAGQAGLLKAVSLGLLGVYLLGFVVLNIRFAKKPALVLSLAVWAALLVAPLDPGYLVKKAGLSPGPARADRPNVILIGLDSLNPRHTGYFGYPLDLTPHIDNFLEDNVVFENCYTPLARTFPAWYAILTGQYPVTNGVRFNLSKRADIRSAGLCLGHALKARGYDTVHFTDEVRFSNITPAEGYDTLVHPTMGIRDFVFGSVHDLSLTNVFFNNPLGYGLFPFLRFNRAVYHLYDGRYFLNKLETTVGRLGRERPLFLTVHLCIGHWPFYHASPRDFSGRRGAEPGMALYDSALSILDEQFGRIMDVLKASGLTENSVIVVLSDHGESAEGHGTDLRDTEQNRALLAIRPASLPTHRQIGPLVRTIDIAPTVFDLLDLDRTGRRFDGTSLRPWIEGRPGPAQAAPDSVIMETEFSLNVGGGVGTAIQSMVEQGIQFYEFDKRGLITVRDDHRDMLVRRRNRAILTPDWKLVRDVLVRGDSDRIETSLFDLHADPQCRNNVARAFPDVYRRLWERLATYYGPEIEPR